MNRYAASPAVACILLTLAMACLAAPELPSDSPPMEPPDRLSPGQPAPDTETLWAHVRSVSDLGELRAMEARFVGAGPDRALVLEVVPRVDAHHYAWCGVPAPDKGWALATRARIETELVNRGPRPVDAGLWTVGRRGWDAVGDFTRIAPGELRRVACDLRETFPDGTPRIDPHRVAQVQVMTRGAGAGATLEIRHLTATGIAPPWVRPAGRIEVPDVEDGAAAPGRRVRYRLPGDQESGVYGVLHLPVDWVRDRRWPIVAEYPGNIFFTRDCYSTGCPDRCVIGYGMTRGRGALWVCLPFVDPRTRAPVDDGWGDPDATADYAVRMLDAIRREFGGDPANVVLTGFSRGALACGYIGLRNERVARLWKGFHACQHYDGDGWRGATLPGALTRARRFAGRAIFHTDNQPAPFRSIMDATRAESTFVQSGLGAHACAMFLDERPSTRQLRQWYDRLIGGH